MIEPTDMWEVAQAWVHKFGPQDSVRVVRVTLTGFFYERNGFIAPQFMAWGRARQQLG